MTIIHLLLSDDWELRGDGSGNMKALQFDNMRRLRDIYSRHDLRATFNVEVMQQLAHREFGREVPSLVALADEWERAVLETYAMGHDVQLHVHPQWTGASYAGGEWRLDGAWSILDYPGDEQRRILERGKTYLENLLRSVDPAYRCVSFRSGSWCLAPGADILRHLADLGVIFDTSIAEGLVYHTRKVTLDYRDVEEGFLPYYPRPDDARKVSRRAERLVCIPTHSMPLRFLPRASAFVAARAARIADRLGPAARRWLVSRYCRPNFAPVPGGGPSRTYASEVWSSDASAARCTRQPSDLSMYNFLGMRAILRDVRRRARACRWEAVPIVLENHTKDIGDFSPFERFAAYVAAADDIEVVTARELAANLRAGMYPVKRAP